MLKVLQVEQMPHYLVTTTNEPSPRNINGLANHFEENQYLIYGNDYYYYNTVTSSNNKAFDLFFQYIGDGKTNNDNYEKVYYFHTFNG